MKYRIGSFKRLTGFSEATLRYYERLGLLSPSRDDGNDYRSYDEEDLLQLVQVSQYSGFDIPLAELPGEGRELSAEAMRALLGERLGSISRADLEPFFVRLAAGSLIPVGDLFGWIVYIAREGGRRRYYLSLRMAVA